MTDLFHRLRRWLWLLRNPMHRVQHLRERGLCIDCGKPLNADEREHYETTCERCEGIRFHELEAAHGVEGCALSGSGKCDCAGLCQRVEDGYAAAGVVWAAADRAAGRPGAFAPLTDMDIANLYERHSTEQWLEFARAVEQAHGIGVVEGRKP